MSKKRIISGKTDRYTHTDRGVCPFGVPKNRIEFYAMKIAGVCSSIGREGACLRVTKP